MTASELRVLRADVSGMPIEWIGYEEAVKLYYLDRVLYPMGQSLLTLRGGGLMRVRVCRALLIFIRLFAPRANLAVILNAILIISRP